MGYCNIMLIISFGLCTHLGNAQVLSNFLSAETAFIGNPGVKVRLTPTGVQHVANVVTKMLAKEVALAGRYMPRFSEHKLLGFTQIGATQPRIKLFSDVTNVSIDFSIPSLLGAHASHINASILFNANGMPAEIMSPGFNIDILLDIKRNERRNPAINIVSCKASSSSGPFFFVSHSMPAQLLFQLQSTASQWAPEFFETVVCSRLNFIVQHRINQRFSLIPSKITLQETANFDLMRAMRDADRQIRRTARANRRRVQRQAQPKNALQAFIAQSFNLSRADGLELDYGMISSPILSLRGIEIDSAGEISAHGTQTPFGPLPLNLPIDASNDMFQIAVSDYVPNSFMYHGHKTGIFNTKITPDTPHFGPTMRTSCDVNSNSLFCVGDLLPTLRDVFPDRLLVFAFSTIQAPTVFVRPLEQGGIKFVLSGKIDVNQMTPNRQETPIGAMNIEIEASMRMRITSKLVKGKVLLENIAMKTLTPGVLVQEELDDAVLLSRELLQRMVNDIIRQGVPIPLHPLFRLRRPKMQLGQRSLLLQTAFTLNRKLITQLTSARLQDH